MKKPVAILMALIFLVAAAACGSAKADTSTWDGVWTATIGSGSDELEISSDIVNNLIVIKIVDSEDSEESLYWQGTWNQSAAIENGTQIVSTGDRDALDASLFGSQNTSKTFTYKNSALVFNMSMYGVTKSIKLHKK